jgi:hypothetical protein
MGPTASTIIALSSLALAALTVLVSYLNVRLQADAAMELEHVKWLREKRDELYGRILAVLARDNWDPIPGPEDKRWADLDEISRLALRYASDAVLAEMQTLVEYRRSLQGVRKGPLLLPKRQAPRPTSVAVSGKNSPVSERQPRPGAGMTRPGVGAIRVSRSRVGGSC